MTTGGPRSGAPPWRHQWDVPADEASRIQRQGAALVVRSGDAVDARRICGVDVAYAPATADRDGTASCRTDGAGGRLVAAAVVIDADRLEPVDEAVAVSTATFGYHPGLFSFRELPAVLDAVARLSRLPDLIVCDGHGIAHPARFGLASHLGLWLDVPTIGCAKRPMVGAHAPLGTERGARNP